LVVDLSFSGGLGHQSDCGQSAAKPVAFHLVDPYSGPYHNAASGTTGTEPPVAALPTSSILSELGAICELAIQPHHSAQ
jgi:hypothetical protein